MSASHHLLPQLLGAVDEEFDQLKRRLSQQGVNARGWRLYADYGDTLFAPFQQGLESTLDAAQAIGLLKLLAACEMDVLPPPILLQSLPRWLPAGQGLDGVPAGFLRAVWKACVAVQYETPEHPKAMAQFVNNTVVPCAQWYFASDQHLDANSSWRNAGWSAICTRWQRALHEELTSGKALSRRPLAGAQWPVFVARVQADGFIFQALHSATMLQAEGQTMSHCVADYVHVCKRSMLRIYAITRTANGERAGTVSVKEVCPGTWAVDELHGHANTPVANEVVPATGALLRSLEDAFFMNAQVRKDMALARSKTARR